MYEFKDLDYLIKDIRSREEIITAQCINEEDILNFTLEFIKRMREYLAGSFTLQPSIRQGIAIPTLLLSKKMRNGYIKIEDLIISAVVTSCIENQAIAYKVAIDIVFGKSTIQKDRLNKSTNLTVSREMRNIVNSSQHNLIETGKKKSSGLDIGGGDEYFLKWLSHPQYNKENIETIYRMGEQILLGYNSNSKSLSTLSINEDFGILSGERIKYFQLGEDYSSIDFEESIDNIISQGKDLSKVRYEDFIIRERKGYRFAVVILGDISGSMSNATKYCIMYIAILLYAFRRHKVALGFFESNLYVLKELFDKKSVEETIKEILLAKTKGGTKGKLIIEWARRQLENVNERYYEKICIICSDMGFHDIEEVTKEIKKMKNEGVKVILIIPPKSNDYKFSINMVKNVEPIIVKLEENEMAKFPNIMREVISNLSES